MRPGKEHSDLCWGDLQLKTDSEGNRFVDFSKERQTKTCTGENPRDWERKSLKCTRTRTTQIAVLLILTRPTKIAAPPPNFLSILLLITKARNQVKSGLMPLAWSQFSKMYAQEHNKRLRTENRQTTRESQHQKAFGSEAGGEWCTARRNHSDNWI